MPQAGGLEAALKGKDLSKVRILLLTSGAINQADCDFIRYQMKALEELDISRVAFGIGDDEYGLKDNKSLKKSSLPRRYAAQPMDGSATPVPRRSSSLVTSCASSVALSSTSEPRRSRSPSR